jgi:acetylornithine deacetylase/succinyl-diaminopimelate desuccinylase-like protein
MLSVIELAAELVRINSVTPKTKSSLNHPGEAALAEWLTDYLQQNDFHVERQPVVGDRPNLIARSRDFQPQYPTLALEAHMDTVDVQGMIISPFSGEIRDGALWGRGSCDVKGTLAAMVTAAILWHHRAKKPGLNVMVLAAMGEEMGTLGSQALVQQQLPFQAVLVGEPTGLQPVTAHKGLWRLAVESYGKACHSSRPEAGVNAIEKMYPILDLFFKELKPDFEKTSENTASLTTLHSGSMINVIPDYGCLEIDARFISATNIEEQWKKWQGLIVRPGVTLRELERKPAFCSRPNSALLASLEQTIRNQGMPFQPQVERYYSDAGHFSAAGYDTILWGAGRIGQAHTADEHIELSQLEQAIDILTALFENIGRS